MLFGAEFSFFFIILALIMVYSLKFPDFPEIISEERKISKFRKYVTPSDGIVQLNKGVYKQQHSDIKEDSVVLTSRKSLKDGTGGVYLVVEIEPNESFSVISMNSEGSIEEGDCGEIYFFIV